MDECERQRGTRGVASSGPNSLTCSTHADLAEPRGAQSSWKYLCTSTSLPKEGEGESVHKATAPKASASKREGKHPAAAGPASPGASLSLLTGEGTLSQHQLLEASKLASALHCLAINTRHFEVPLSAKKLPAGRRFPNTKTQILPPEVMISIRGPGSEVPSLQHCKLWVKLVLGRDEQQCLGVQKLS